MSADRSGRLFLDVDDVEVAFQKLYGRAAERWRTVERVPLESALDRYLAEDARAPSDVPHFRRSTVDGYAARSEDVALAGEASPAILRTVGAVRIGEAAFEPVGDGECAEVPTGGMIPDGADAVVMSEYARSAGEGWVALLSGASYGENVVSIGEERRAGESILPRGRRLAPRDLGALAAAGVASVPVFARPKLAVLSTGDEIVPYDADPPLGKIRDANSTLLASMATRCGYEVVAVRAVSEGSGPLARELRGLLGACELIAVSGGSSKGPSDGTYDAIRDACAPGAFTRGIALQPGKPTVLGFDEPSGTLVAGLPGHPVSAMTAFELLFHRLIREAFYGVPPPAIPARLTANVPASPGRLTCRPASLARSGSGYDATPIFHKSGLIAPLARADGYFLIERDREGLREGELVFVHPYPS